MKEVKIFLDVLVFLELSVGSVGPKTSCLGVKEVVCEVVYILYLYEKGYINPRYFYFIASISIFLFLIAFIFLSYLSFNCIYTGVYALASTKESFHVKAFPI